MKTPRAPAARGAGVPPAAPPRGWHSRGYLPHFDGGGIAQFVTFRLEDSLPVSLLESWEAELAHWPKRSRKAERCSRIEAFLDKGWGECWLRDPRIASLVRKALLFFHRRRYTLHAWAIMPNHVHVLCTPDPAWSVSSVLHSWKSYTAKCANRILGRRGEFWQADYFDRYVRDDGHFFSVLDYIESNPVRGGLCTKNEAWVYGSAFFRAGEIALSRVAAGETPAPRVAAGETPAPRVAAGETPAPRVAAGGTPAPRVAAGETPAPRAAAGETPAPRVAAGGTPAPREGEA